MSIVKMKKLRVLAVKSQREALMRELMLLGCVEISQPEEMQGVEDIPQLERYSSDEIYDLREELRILNQAIYVLDMYAPEKRGMFTPRTAVAQAVLLDESNLKAAGEKARELVQAEERIRRLASEESRLGMTVESLQPWRKLETDLDMLGTRSCDVICGMLPGSVVQEEVELTLAAAVPEAQIFWVSGNKEQKYVQLICHKSVRQQALEALRPYGFAQAQFGELKGSAADNIKRAEKALADLKQRRAKEIAGITSGAQQRFELQLAAEQIGIRLDRAEAENNLLCTGEAVMFWGWIPAQECDKLESLLSGYDCAWELTEPEPEEYPEVPVKLKNNILTQPLNMVTDMYSLPAYDGVDPNPLMAPFFVLCYGIMMADMGYGILMVLGGIFMLTKMRAKGGMKNFAGLLVLCGISTFVVGAMTGGFFGDFIPQIAKIVNPGTTLTALPALFTPLEDTIAILLGSLVLGLIQIITGMVISVVRKIQTGDFIGALFDEITWWIILAGAALAILGIGSVAGVPVVLIVGILMLAVGGTRKAKGFGKLTSFIGLVYNGVSGFFSDILSYARIMALMLAGAVIAQVFNTLGSVTGNVVIFVIISIIGNALNFALNLLGCYVHDLRLQCLEFFNRFYKEGGRPFNPVEIKTKYIDVENI